MNERRTVQLPGAGLKCRNCEAPLSGVERTIEGENFIERRRKCESCGFINETIERVANVRPLRPRRRTIRREDYF